MRQVEVKRKNMKRICWTEDHQFLKKGNCIRFKEENQFWDIEKVFDNILEKNEINRNWHVGGL